MPLHRVSSPSHIVELRQYTLHAGQRDTLIALFEREFIEPQEALGIEVIGSFRDLDDADRFVWLRGFRDMASRPAALAGFYDGGVWKAHRNAANATMIDSDDVLLLRPAHPSLAFSPPEDERPPPGAAQAARGMVSATILLLDAPPADALIDLFRLQARPLLKRLGAEVLACLVTQPGANSYPRLPVREGQHALVWLLRFADEDAHRRHLAACAASPTWRDEVAPALQAHAIGEPQCLRLAPTARSAIHA
jgi:hypothetical protein